jgi:hypothetical protein
LDVVILMGLESTITGVVGVAMVVAIAVAVVVGIVVVPGVVGAMVVAGVVVATVVAAVADATEVPVIVGVVVVAVFEILRVSCERDEAASICRPWLDNALPIPIAKIIAHANSATKIPKYFVFILTIPLLELIQVTREVMSAVALPE